MLNILYTFFISLLLINPNIDASNKADETSVDLKYASKLNTTLENELTQLDNINSILQFLAQLANKGNLEIKNKTAVLAWINSNINSIKTLQKAHKLPLLESDLNGIALASRALIVNINEAISNNFKNIETLDINTLIGGLRSHCELTKIDKLIQDNESILNELKNKSNQIGLTMVNIIARKLDSLNGKYNLISRLEKIPLFLLSAAIGIYITPKRWYTQGCLKSVFGLPKIKNFLGTSQFDPNLEDIHKRKIITNGRNLEQSHTPTGFIDKIITFSKDRDIQWASGIISMLIGWHYYNKPLPYTTEIRLWLSNQWDKLKGFIPENDNNYKIIEDITLDDERLIGLDNQIEELRNLVRYITNPEIYDRSDSKLEKGVLLTGPSRTGKTLAASALCGTLNAALKDLGMQTKYSFKEIKWEQIMWTSDGIKQLIDEAKKNAPCVLFIDEIHNFPLQTKEGGQTLTHFLTGMSGINTENDARHQVILLAATNKPWLLDSALLQPGRFGTIIHFEKPNFKNRKKYFETMFKRNAIDTESLDIDMLVRQTDGCSYGDLETVIKNARFIARTLAKGVTKEHLQLRLDTHVHRLKNEIPTVASEKKMVSTYLAGQALLYLLLKPNKKLEFVTIRGRWPKIVEDRFFLENKKKIAKSYTSKFGFICTYNQSESLHIETNKEKELLCSIKLGGTLAQKIILNGYDNNFRPKDKNKALQLAKDIVFDGLVEKDLPKNIQERLKNDAFALLKKLESETYNLLTKNKELLLEIAQLLETKVTLSSEDLQGMINERKL